MNVVQIENISHRIHDPENYTHLLFTDESGIRRLGRVLPYSFSVNDLESLFRLTGCPAGIAIPDGYSFLADTSICISLSLENKTLLSTATAFEKLCTPLRALNSSGLSHLSIDGNSLLENSRDEIEMVFWGDGLLKQHPAVPPEIRAGGFAYPVSDLYMLAKAALNRDWLSEAGDIRTAKALISENYFERCKTAVENGFFSILPELEICIPDKPGFTTISGGSWQSRDAEVNHLACIASRMGWACRVIRKALGETGRPLPDTPSGTITTNPEELLQNAFKGQGGIERLLILCDVTQDQEDMIALLGELSGVIPPGLHLVLAGRKPPVFRGSQVTTLQGKTCEAVDSRLTADRVTLGWKGTGPAWFGPRCRADAEDTPISSAVHIPDEILYQEGAWRWITSHTDLHSPEVLSESLYRLGRYREALTIVPSGERVQKSKILIALGQFSEAAEILTSQNEAALLARAFRGMGQISQALDTLSKSQSPGDLPELAELYDLSGKPSSGLKPLKEGLLKAGGTVKIDIYCSLRNLEMRLGFYRDALEHAEVAVRLSREIAGSHHLIRSLQARGRTLLVLGRWRDAEADFSTATALFRDNALSMKRPVQVDLFDLQLRMGHIRQAQATLENLEGMLSRGGIPAKQMLLMLKASMGVHLGKGETAIPDALKAEETAASHGMELYSGISTLYAGILYLQSGRRNRGIDLLNKARSAGHVLGDKHLICLAEIELLLEGSLQNTTIPQDMEMEKDLSEEHLILNIIRNTEVEASFEQLLRLPSPLTACRIADRCGFPDSAKLTETILNSRENLCRQMTEEERETYLSRFTRNWDELPGEQVVKVRYPELLQKVSSWISDYNEGTADLNQLKDLLNLESVSLKQGKNLISVSRNWPLFISGKNAENLIPVLLPAAAAIASGPPPAAYSAPLSDSGSGIVGDSSAMKKIRFEIQRYAREDVPILITGETGTGKEICAREIHRLSRRRSNCFIPVDCGAIPENLMESEFFGAVAGAYTGIQASRKGLLEEADEGTLFLDELGNLPLHMQAKLLRVLDTGIFRRLGETRERRTDLRIVAASNSDMDRLLEEGLFRRDLYYRLAVIRLHLPPLRERSRDLEQLAVHFSGKTVSPAALAALREYNWPGNVRELQNVMKRAAINSGDSSIRKCHISVSSYSSHAESVVTLQEAIKNHIRKTVDSLGGNRSRAAKALECDPKTLRKYLNQ